MLRWNVVLLLWTFSRTDVFVLVSGAEQITNSIQPHIIIILADDLGWNDVSFHNSNLFQTPNIDALAYNGIILQDFHTPSLCTPSRASLMTGKFPIFTGMQRKVILEPEPWGLPLDLKIFPQYLNSVGYESHLVGKWHLGFYRKAFTPTERGFKSFFGYWQGHQDYFTHLCQETFGDFEGYDFHDDLMTRDDLKNLYATDLYTAMATYRIQQHDKTKPLFLMLSQIATHAGEKYDPLQAPPDEIEKFHYIPSPEKQKYAAMVSKLDQSVGEIVNALKENGMLENSIIMFMSDNGAPTVGVHANTGSNYPFRGMKQTEFEGGTRVPAIIWSPLLNNQQRVSSIMMHMVDVLPTLCTAAGINVEDLDIDGINMWKTLKEGSEISPRSQYPYNIDPATREHAVGAIRKGDFKYYQGDDSLTGDSASWLGNKSPNIDFADYDYSIDNILRSTVNKAISSLYKEVASNALAPESNLRVPLTATKILQSRKETEIACPKLESLPECDPTKTCLFNLKEDPCERYDYSTVNPAYLELMKQEFEKYRYKVVAPLNQPRDICANPALWNGHWVNWYDFDAVFHNISFEGKCRPHSSYTGVYPWCGVWKNIP